MTSNAPSQATWGIWNGGMLTVSTQIITMGSNVTLWQTWNNVYTLAPTTLGNVVSYGYGSVESEEERVVRLEKEKIVLQEMKEKEERAEKILLSVLDEKQKETWKAEKRFEVVVKGKIYRIKKRERVQLLDEKGKVKTAYCIHPDSSHALPSEDIVLTQKLLLESDEEAFLKIANSYQVA